jgi:diguanylate cyclase (GGDEF)-like protein
MSYVLRFFDLFLPPSQCTNPSDLVRGYILLGLIVADTLFALGSMLGLRFALDLGDSLPIALGLDALCLVGYAIALAVLRFAGSYHAACYLVLAVHTGVIFVGLQITGGFLASPVLQVSLLVPVVAFLLLGLYQGFLWLWVTIGLSLASYVCARLGIAELQLVPNQEAAAAMYVMLFYVTVIATGGALTVYEILNGMLKRELLAEKLKLEHWASHDDLTGVPNRFEFFRRLKAGIDEAREREHKVGVVYIDLDGFKPINDEHGHHMGDEALKAVAKRLRRVLRLSDTAARLGGDEFGLILPGIHVPEDIEMIMPKILAAIREPIRVGDVEFVVRGSCGVAIYPNHSRDYDALCRFADAAMYRAKARSDAYQVFQENLEADPA